ncbi:MAG: hypothetical protein ABI548_07760 [Polyangiaceae bacterium]
MFTLRRVCAFLATLLVLVVVGRAHAQTLTPTLSVTKTGVTHTAPRNGNRLTTFINKADCVADDVMTFPITATNFSGYSLQAWVGTSDCTQTAARTTLVTCWKVLDSTVTTGSSSLSSGSTSVQLHTRDIVSGYTIGIASSGAVSGTAGASSTAGSGGADGGGSSGTGGVAGSDAAATGSGQLVSGTGVNACNQPNSTVVQGATAITVYFMLIDPSTFNAVASASWPGTFKLVGPQPPDNVTAGVGGNLLVVNFTYNGTPVDTTGNGFNLYCDPPPGTQAAEDAGLVDDAGVGTATTCGAPVSDVLVQGNDPPTDSKYLCGGGQHSSTKANATGLVNNVPYNVAVAAVDTYENVGPLSSLSCAVPQPISGFYKAYQDAGGTAGGGFCSFSTKREPFILLAIFGLATGLVLRRRRSA